MSHTGFKPDAGGGNTPANNGNTPAQGRDAWNNPIKPVKEPTNADDNGGVDDKMVDDLWNDIQTPKGDDKKEPQTIIVKQEPAAKSPADNLKDHLASVGLGEFTLSEAEKAELQAGNFDLLTNKMHELSVNAYTKALSGSQTLIQEQVKKAVEEATKNSRSYVEGKDLLEALHTAVPATKHPAIGPVAQTVMQRLIDRGATKDQAIEGVKKWSKIFAKEMGFDTEVNSNRNGSFRGGQNSEGSGETNWLDILTPKGR
jgi:hypothetical protein